MNSIKIDVIESRSSDTILIKNNLKAKNVEFKNIQAENSNIESANINTTNINTANINTANIDIIPDGVNDDNPINKRQLDQIQTNLESVIPIGGYVFVQTNLIGSQQPDPEKFIRLQAGLIGSGQYNEGKITGHTDSSSGRTLISTAIINDSSSLLFGTTIHLLEREERFLRAGGTIGSVQNDSMQNLTGNISRPGFQSGDYAGWLESGTYDGIFAPLNLSFGRILAPTGANGGRFETVNFDAARQSRTSDENRSKNIRVAVYMRYK